MRVNLIAKLQHVAKMTPGVLDAVEKILFFSAGNMCQGKSRSNPYFQIGKHGFCRFCHMLVLKKRFCAMFAAVAMHQMAGETILTHLAFPRLGKGEQVFAIHKLKPQAVFFVQGDSGANMQARDKGLGILQFFVILKISARYFVMNQKAEIGSGK